MSWKNSISSLFSAINLKSVVDFASFYGSSEMEGVCIVAHNYKEKSEIITKPCKYFVMIGSIHSELEICHPNL